MGPTESPPQWPPCKKGLRILEAISRLVRAPTQCRKGLWIHPALWDSGGGITSRACSEKPWGEEFPQTPRSCLPLFSTRPCGLAGLGYACPQDRHQTYPFPTPTLTWEHDPE